ncbi:hypothetical protein [Bradyrhizobium sp. CB1015]|uniref:hypothetical protein n=1 Tax=Bradyrhizobium sp. CB1015 TaxID=2976822 RepID=UPI0021AA219F|nr:hypothetical protein [Bradyrhizobium sp. CB1015]UWU90218.1 hypothetical protein N2604_27570 [Bradyrhizobium sp. CB1015]
MKQQEQLLYGLSAEELWLLRKDVRAKLATILLKRKRMLEARLEQLQPRRGRRRIRVR